MTEPEEQTNPKKPWLFAPDAEKLKVTGWIYLALLGLFLVSLAIQACPPSHSLFSLCLPLGWQLIIFLLGLGVLPALLLVAGVLAGIYVGVSILLAVLDQDVSSQSVGRKN